MGAPQTTTCSVFHRQGGRREPSLVIFFRYFRFSVTLGFGFVTFGSRDRIPINHSICGTRFYCVAQHHVCACVCVCVSMCVCVSAHHANTRAALYRQKAQTLQMAEIAQSKKRKAQLQAQLAKQK